MSHRCRAHTVVIIEHVFLSSHFSWCYCCCCRRSVHYVWLLGLSPSLRRSLGVLFTFWFYKLNFCIRDKLCIFITERVFNETMNAQPLQEKEIHDLRPNNTQKEKKQQQKNTHTIRPRHDFSCLDSCTRWRTHEISTNTIKKRHEWFYFLLSARSVVVYNAIEKMNTLTKFKREEKTTTWTWFNCRVQ